MQFVLIMLFFFRYFCNVNSVLLRVLLLCFKNKSFKLQSGSSILSWLYEDWLQNLILGDNIKNSKISAE